jgi:hypothetical protein
VTVERLLIRYFTASGYFKALLCAGIGFNLWHYFSFNFYTLAGVSEQPEHLWSHVGNVFSKILFAETQKQNGVRRY